MFYKKSVLSVILVLANQVYQQVERFKLHFSAIGLNRAIDTEIALLGERMFKLRRQEISFLNRDPSLSVLIDKIRADRNVLYGVSNNKNNYLLNICMYISKLFNKIF